MAYKTLNFLNCYYYQHIYKLLLLLQEHSFMMNNIISCYLHLIHHKTVEECHILYTSL